MIPTTKYSRLGVKINFTIIWSEVKTKYKVFLANSTLGPLISRFVDMFSKIYTLCGHPLGITLDYFNYQK